MRRDFNGSGGFRVQGSEQLWQPGWLNFPRRPRGADMAIARQTLLENAYLAVQSKTSPPAAEGWVSG
jgi:hypothetical protein